MAWIDIGRGVVKLEQTPGVEIGRGGVAIVVGDRRDHLDETGRQAHELVFSRRIDMNHGASLVERHVACHGIDRDDENDIGRVRADPANDVIALFGNGDGIARQRIDEPARPARCRERVVDRTRAIGTVIVREGAGEIAGCVRVEVGLVDHERVRRHAFVDDDACDDVVVVVCAHLDCRLVVDDADVEGGRGRRAVGVGEFHHELFEDAVLAGAGMRFGGQKRVGVGDDTGHRVERGELQFVAERCRDCDRREHAIRDDGRGADGEIIEAVGRGNIETAGGGSGFGRIRLSGPGRIEYRARKSILVDDRIATQQGWRQVGDLHRVVGAEDRDLEDRALGDEAVGRLVLEVLAERFAFAQSLHRCESARLLRGGVELVGIGTVRVQRQDAELTEDGAGRGDLEDVAVGVGVAVVGEAAKGRARVRDRLEHITLGGKWPVLFDPVAIGAKHGRGVEAAKLLERKDSGLSLEGHDATPRNRYRTRTGTPVPRGTCPGAAAGVIVRIVLLLRWASRRSA